MLSLYQTALAQ